MLYSDEARRVYPYNDGERDLYADPLELRARLVRAAGGDLAGLAEAAAGEAAAGEGTASPEKALARVDAQEKLAAVIRQAFGLAPFDPATGKGTTVAQAWELWDHFHEWLEGNASAAGS